MLCVPTLPFLYLQCSVRALETNLGGDTLVNNLLIVQPPAKPRTDLVFISLFSADHHRTPQALRPFPLNALCYKHGLPLAPPCSYRRTPTEAEAPPGSGADDAGTPPSPSDEQQSAVKEEVQTAERQGSGGEGSSAEGATEGQEGVEPESAAANPVVDDKVATDASGPRVSESTDGEEMTSVGQEAMDQKPDDESEPRGTSSPRATSDGDNPKDGDEERGGKGPATAGTEPEQDSSSSSSSIEMKPGNADKSIAKVEPSGASEGDGVSPRPAGEAMVVEEEGGGEVVRADSSSSDEEDDGFRVVVGREAAPTVTPVVPTKRFLRGECKGRACVPTEEARFAMIVAEENKCVWTATYGTAVL